MKAVFAAFYQAFYDEVMDILDKNDIRGFTFWNDVQGRGSHDGEPHYGNHAWPAQNSALIAFMPDEKVKPLVEALHQLDMSAEQQGLRVFVLTAEEMTDRDL